MDLNFTCYDLVVEYKKFICLTFKTKGFQHFHLPIFKSVRIIRIILITSTQNFCLFSTIDDHLGLELPKYFESVVWNCLVDICGFNVKTKHQNNKTTNVSTKLLSDFFVKKRFLSTIFQNSAVTKIHDEAADSQHAQL